MHEVRNDDDAMMHSLPLILKKPLFTVLSWCSLILQYCPSLLPSLEASPLHHVGQVVLNGFTADLHAELLVLDAVDKEGEAFLPHWIVGRIDDLYNVERIELLIHIS